MSERCYECDDFVSEWGEPICMGCYRTVVKQRNDLREDNQKLKEENKQLLTDYLIVQRKLRNNPEDVVVAK
jgi:hypothetical protein